MMGIKRKSNHTNNQQVWGVYTYPHLNHFVGRKTPNSPPGKTNVCKTA